jgi:hypothetical protein
VGLYVFIPAVDYLERGVNKAAVVDVHGTPPSLRYPPQSSLLPLGTATASVGTGLTQLDVIQLTWPELARQAVSLV